MLERNINWLLLVCAPTKHGTCRLTGTTTNRETLQNRPARSKIPPLGTFKQWDEWETPNRDFKSMRILEGSTWEQDRELWLLLRPGKASLSSTCCLGLPQHLWEASWSILWCSELLTLLLQRGKLNIPILNQQWPPTPQKQGPKSPEKAKGVGST